MSSCLFSKSMLGGWDTIKALSNDEQGREIEYGVVDQQTTMELMLSELDNRVRNYVHGRDKKATNHGRFK